MALTTEQADAMIAARDRSGRMLSVFHNRRWDWDFVTIKEMLAQGLISAHEADWRPPEPPKPAAKAMPAPFSVAEVETGLKNWITTRRMATLVQQFGVDFPLSDATRKRLADAGADPVLLQIISASKRSL